MSIGGGCASSSSAVEKNIASILSMVTCRCGFENADINNYWWVCSSSGWLVCDSVAVDKSEEYMQGVPPLTGLLPLTEDFSYLWHAHLNFQL